MFTFKKIYKYECKKCGNSRQTVSEQIAKKGICAKCKKSTQIEGQMDIFGGVYKNKLKQ